jgi:hypothetical protein
VKLSSGGLSVAKILSDGNETVVDQANLTIAEFVLREDMRLEHAVEKCGCKNCKDQREDAIDRRDWALGLFAWDDKEVYNGTCD